MADENGKKYETKYRDNEIDGFRLGGLFDLRVRMAYDMLVQGDLSSLVWGLRPSEGTGKSDEQIAEERGVMAARAALSATSELIRLAEASGLVEPFPENGITRMLRKRAGQLAEWGAEQAVVNHRKQSEMAGRIAVPPGTAAASPILPGDGGGGKLN